MPLYPGLWQPSPGPLIVGALGAATDSSVVQAYSGLGSDFAALCEPPATPIGSYTEPRTAEVSYFLSGPPFPDVYIVQQALAEWDLTAALDTLLYPGNWSPPLPWPAGAADWEWDRSGDGPGHGTAVYVASLTIAGTMSDTTAIGQTPIDADIILVPQDPATLTYSTLDPYYPLAEPQPVPGAALAPILGPTAAPSFLNSIDVSVDLTDLSYLSGLATSSAPVVLSVVTALDAQRTHTAPTLGTGRKLQWVTQPVLTIHYTPPRWRFLYAIPPAQRQFPRDDGLGISTHRSWPPPTSTQYSQRRGPNATYQ